jgi:hypothetical protein
LGIIVVLRGLGPLPDGCLAEVGTLPHYKRLFIVTNIIQKLASKTESDENAVAVALIAVATSIGGVVLFGALVL